MSHEDWLPTFLAAAGVPDIVDKLKKGYTANGKEWKVHLDGYDFLPFFKGDVDEGPRDTIYYFGQGGELNADPLERLEDHVRDDRRQHRDLGERVVTNWPLITHLRADPYEEMWKEGEMGYLRWYGDNMWLFVPVQAKLREFFKSTIPEYPFQEGSSLSAGGINYNSLKAMKALQDARRARGALPGRTLDWAIENDRARREARVSRRNRLRGSHGQHSKVQARNVVGDPAGRCRRRSGPRRRPDCSRRAASPVLSSWSYRRRRRLELPDHGAAPRPSTTSSTRGSTGSSNRPRPRPRRC